MDIINFSKIAAPKFEFGCGFYFCVIGALKYIIGLLYICTLYFANLLKTNHGQHKDCW